MNYLMSLHNELIDGGELVLLGSSRGETLHGLLQFGVISRS